MPGTDLREACKKHCSKRAWNFTGHAKIAEWRRQQSLIRTKRWRPDLLEEANLSDKERAFLGTLE